MKKQAKYKPDVTYKITITMNNGEQVYKYFKGIEMEEKLRILQTKKSKYKYYWIEEEK